LNFIGFKKENDEYSTLLSNTNTRPEKDVSRLMNKK